jgi:hypothetical protein
MRQPMKSPQVKGAAVADFLEWISRTRGPHVVQDAWSRLPADARDELGQEPRRLLPFRWYSAHAIFALINALTAHLPAEEQHAMARDGTRAMVEHTFRGLYGSVFRMLVTPRRYVERVQTIWSLFHDTGVIVGQVLGPRQHVTRLRDWRSRHPFIILLNQYFALFLYEAMGCRGIIVNGAEERHQDGVVDMIHICWQEDPR